MSKFSSELLDVVAMLDAMERKQRSAAAAFKYRHQKTPCLIVAGALSDVREAIERGEHIGARDRVLYREQAGYKHHRHYAPSQSDIVVYIAREQGMDVDGRYAVVCTRHSTLVGVATLALAKQDAYFPAFCEECMAATK